MDISEVKTFYEETKSNTASIREELDNVKANLDQVMQMDTFQGKAADTAKEYFKVLHEPLLQAFKSIFEQLERDIANHLQDFYEEIDASDKAVIDDTYLEEK
ncbi:T7SS effector LXG polymorphic toxin [Salipaludibacillus sp. HK11]|uniref:T7SS effector LXG polymorphic toxin n=1 Tax=Salipaludibacillus sp. HK11 TaxID=3394320 RepID=UPI0039FDD80F